MPDDTADRVMYALAVVLRRKLAAGEPVRQDLLDLIDGLMPGWREVPDA